MVNKVAKAFPDQKFAIVDAEVELPNVASLVFKEHEGSFLVGALAAMKTETKKIGFVEMCIRDRNKRARRVRQRLSRRRLAHLLNGRSTQGVDECRCV